MLLVKQIDQALDKALSDPDPKPSNSVLTDIYSRAARKCTNMFGALAAMCAGAGNSLENLAVFENPSNEQLLAEYCLYDYAFNNVYFAPIDDVTKLPEKYLIGLGYQNQSVNNGGGATNHNQNGDY